MQLNIHHLFLIVMGFISLSISNSHAQQNNNSCNAILHNYQNDNVTLISAKDIQQGPRNPAYCKVFGTITPDIGFEVRLPKEWNSRFYMVGNEGSGGKINSRNMNLPLSMNYATASTDLGHNGYMEGARDLTWSYAAHLSALLSVK